MKVVLEDCNGARVVKIRIGSQHDVTANRMCAEAAARAAQNPEAAALVVDLNDAHRLSDSVIAMLTDLKSKAVYLGIPLRSVNVSQDIRRRLSMLQFSTIHKNRYASVGVYAHQVRFAPV